MNKTFSLLIFAVVLMSSGIAVADDDGHCNYTHESMYSDEPFKLCSMPTSPMDCEELGNADDNTDAEYGDDECSAKGAIGTCETDESKVVYYNGDTDGLEIGCGFQNGEWVNAE